ncbi:MAG: enoyl-CoA hydratase/isomerase family protein [Arenimonas sp.]|nr:enoyl-CoA hydratase/isomerase family protein [Arenimonas sp.]
MTNSVLLIRTGSRATITLNRPSSHNAFDAELIAALTEALQQVAADASLRCLVLTGAGNTFSAGADLNWMRDMASASEQDNVADAQALALCLRTLNNLPIPTLARVNGSAYGGGVGLIACCDIAVSVESAKFTLSEVKLGLVPAVISPYVIAAIGARQARRYFLSAEIFDAPNAKQIGLIHECVAAEQLDETLDRILHWLGKGGKQAQMEAKQLIHAYQAANTIENMQVQDNQNAKLIARLRVSNEGQQGLNAFLEKRPADWLSKDNP